MKHFLLAVSLVTFALPNGTSFAQSEEEARTARVQQHRARQHAGIERMIAPSTRAQAQQAQQGQPRVERPQRGQPGGGRQFNAPPRVQPQRPNFTRNPNMPAQPRMGRGGFQRGGDSPSRGARTFTPRAPVEGSVDRRSPRRTWSGDGSDLQRRDWVNRTGPRGRDWSGGNRGAISPDAQGRAEAFSGRNWQNRGGNDWTNRTGGRGDWRNRGGDRNWNRGGNWSQRHGHWDRTRRDRSWWRNNYTRFVLFGGGYYYLHNNYWYPAYGYDPYFSTYIYDAPLYAYNGLAPEQVIAEVQSELQRQGYYRGVVDGSFGPMTRRALIHYQEEVGLPVTGEIDEETLMSLGFE